MGVHLPTQVVQIWRFFFFHVLSRLNQLLFLQDNVNGTIQMTSECLLENSFVLPSVSRFYSLPRQITDESDLTDDDANSFK